MSEIKQIVAKLNLEIERLSARLARLERALGLDSGPPSERAARKARPDWLKKPNYTNKTPEIFTRNITTLGLSTRAMNIMLELDIETVGELAVMQPNEFSRFKGVGKGVINECATALKSIGLAFGVPTSKLKEAK